MKKFMKWFTVCVVLCTVALLTVIVSSAESDEWAFLPFDKELYYGRAQLEKLEDGENMVKVYDMIVRAVEDGHTELVINTKTSVDDIVLTCSQLDTVYLAHRYDNPQQFWIKGYGYRYYNDGTVYSVVLSYIEGLNTEEARAEFNNAVEELLAESGVDSAMSEYEIELRLHDALAERITYTETPFCRNVYGAIVEGKAVCEGYAESLQYLLYLMGIQAHCVAGDANGGHEWTLVKIEGEYYYVDLTWNDSDSQYKYYGYFNTTTERLLGEGRTFDDCGYDLPVCDSESGHYYNRAGYGGRNFKTEPSVENAVTQLKYFGKARFYYNGNGSYSSSNFKAWVSANISVIGDSLGLNGFTYSTSVNKREFILELSGVTVQPLPDIDILPKLNMVLSDTGFNVVTETAVGNVVTMAAPSGRYAFTLAEANDMINNARVSIVSANGILCTGSKMIIENEEAYIVVVGDVDGDGELSVFDANMIKKASESQDGGNVFDSEMKLQKFAGDINGDSEYDESDITLMMKHVTGK